MKPGISDQTSHPGTSGPRDYSHFTYHTAEWALLHTNFHYVTFCFEQNRYTIVA